VTFTDNCPRIPSTGATGAELITQDPAPGTLVGPGEHDIVVSVTDARGNVGSCVTRFTVIGPTQPPPAPPTAHCPADITVPCLDDNGALVNYTAFVTVGCNDIPMECTPPPGFFPVGKTTVTCVYNGVAPPLVCSFTVTVNCAKISVNISGNNTLSISVSGSQVLQVADSIFGPWTDLPGGAPTLNVRTDEGRQKFYRIRP
jgi:hypothetical protein